MSLVQTRHQSAPNGGTHSHSDSQIVPSRYNDEELEEFREIILKKKEAAKEVITFNQGIILAIESNKNEATSFAKTDEDYDLDAKENAQKEILRQKDFIVKLDWALVRIENKTYGICHQRQILIDKNRLRVVPHATLSIEAKNNRNNLN